MVFATCEANNYTVNMNSATTTPQKPTTTTQPISFRLTQEMDEQLDELAKYNGIPKAAIIKIALASYLRAVKEGREVVDHPGASALPA